MERVLIKELFSPQFLDCEVLIKGWVRSIRQAKRFCFIVINDGSSFRDLQVVADASLESYQQAQGAGVGAAMVIRGTLVESQGKGQSVELMALELELVGAVDEDYPLQKKGHSLEFLRTKAHLRPRTRTMSAVFRVRSCLSYATHQFFRQRGFYYLHSPVISALDCEGAGDLFRVTTLELAGKLPRNSEGGIDFKQDYFAQPSYLTVSGQLAAECFAQGMGSVYTFGPTFRSENSHTPRHLAEFWMIEPEMAFCNLPEMVGLASEYLKFLVGAALAECGEELAFLHQQYAPGRGEELQRTVDSQVVTLCYGDAVEILRRGGAKFEFPVAWGKDLQTEHERFLTDKHFKCPVVVVDYPLELKAFYVKQNSDGQTVGAMDFLVPGVGELMGGGQREENDSKLMRRMGELAMDPRDYWWYLELRRFGSTPHSGFGLGLERAVMYVTGMANIRDVIAFPRTPSNVEF